MELCLRAKEKVSALVNVKVEARIEMEVGRQVSARGDAEVLRASMAALSELDARHRFVHKGCYQSQA